MRWPVLALLFALVLSPSLASAQADADEDDAHAIAWAGAAVSTCAVAFDVYLLTREDTAFGPPALVDASVALSIVGAVGAHVAAFALLDERLALDASTRSRLMGLAMVSTGLSLLAFALPTAWALTSDPPTGDESVAIVAPYALGAIGVLAMIAGSWMLVSPGEPTSAAASLSVAATPTSASLWLRGRF